MLHQGLQAGAEPVGMDNYKGVDLGAVGIPIEQQLQLGVPFDQEPGTEAVPFRHELQVWQMMRDGARGQDGCGSW